MPPAEKLPNTNFTTCPDIDCHVEPGRDIRIVPETAFRSEPDFSTALRFARNDIGGLCFALSDSVGLRFALSDIGALRS